MPGTQTTFRLQELIDAVEALPADDQEILIDDVKNRMIQRWRARLVEEVGEARAEFSRGELRIGNVQDLMAGLRSTLQTQDHNDQDN